MPLKQMPLNPRAPLLRTPRVVIASGMHGTGVTTIAEYMQLATTSIQVVDGGAQWADILEACMPGFVRLLAVTTHDIVSVSSTYALIKLVRDRFPAAPVEVLVNQGDARTALKTYERIQGAASHFLGETIGYAGAIPDDSHSAHPLAEERNDPLTHSSVMGEGVEVAVVAAIQDVAMRLDEELGWTASHTAPHMNEGRTSR